MKRALFTVFLLAACGESSPPASKNPTTASATVTATASQTATATASASTGVATPPKDIVCEALDKERETENAKLKTITENKDPLSHVQSMNEDVMGTFTKCIKTKSGGAWGLGLKELK